MALWSLKGYRILVIDDFPDMRAAIRGMLIGYNPEEIVLARDGDEAISALEKKRFELVLCDYNLGPGRDGQQVLEEAKHRNLLPATTLFVMVTAENTADMVMGALEYQPDDYLSKPITRDTLQSRLRKLMEKRASLLDIYRALDARDYHAALRHCEARIAAANRLQLNLLKIKCDLLLKLEQYEAAGTLCEEVLKERDIPWAAFNLGMVRFHQQRYDLARDAFLEVIEINDAFGIAYDWLARTQEKLGELAAAQRTLMNGVEKSPKALLRQRFLAEIATRNEDYKTAETARRQAVRVGKNSVLKKAEDYTGLAKVMLKTDSRRNPMEVLDAIKHEFRDDPDAALECAVARSSIHHARGDERASAEAVQDALKLFAARGGTASSEVAMELATNCLAHGNRDQADAIVKQVVCNHYEDEATLGRIKKIYDDAGLGAEGDSIVTTTREEAVRINNQGVRLIEEGKIEESIELFTNALKGMPKNAVVNLNAAHALILSMEQDRVTHRRLTQALAYLDVARAAGGTTDRYHQLVSACQSLAATRAAS